ncbi:DUF2270 domain-containing protein [Archangium primigenium]|uniref:DUF2270 domain-containing protein n=1 Tax=[Archangium] primigenium TaxID=2792470 RepID=UPI00195D359D|nr:DUF2270 domain-containing protein [Archangium primigenium]MBM7113632.1 DUF2270 domain-containing protein [Archangium primigenium]
MANDMTERDKGEDAPPPVSDAAMAQLFRGELSRSDTWRSRLDTTTNWALTTSAAVVSFGLSSTGSPVVFLVGIWLVLTFLLIEARRYRYYDLWIRRVRLLENGYWVPLLRREPIDPDAIRELVTLVERPQIHLSLFSAISTRLNRAYGPILLVLTTTWFVKVYSHPRPPRDLDDFLHRAAVGPLPGEVVMGFLLVLMLGFTYLFAASFFTRAPMGELRTLPRGRRAALWESFYRPYATRAPRRRGGAGAGPGPRQTPPMH